MNSRVILKNELLEMILEGARRLHPRESIVLLRGKVEKEGIRVSDVLIPPLATYGRGFSSFPGYMLPMDFSIVGVAHSHPSGNLKPSVGDQNLSVGRIMLIVGFPYAGKENAKAYTKQGQSLILEVV